MQLILALLKPLGSMALGMISALLTGPVMKRLIGHYLEAQVKKYSKKAASTEDKQDDVKAEMIEKAWADIKKAWEI